MRRDLLPPPREMTAPVPAATGPWPTATSPPPPARERLDGPSPAREQRRPLFHPRRGWLRRAERAFSHWLSHHVFPRIPGMQIPYDFIMRRQLTLTEGEVQLRGLPAAFEGLRVLLISDIHAGPFVSPSVLCETFQRLQSLAPDLVVLPGDLTTAQVGEFDEAREAFSVLEAPLGVWAVLGNHDHYTEDAGLLTRKVEALGIEVLHNRSARLERDGAALTLAGVDDMLLGEPDLDAALSGATGPVILLSHNPDLFFEAARRGVDLMLSGHTHAGQVRIPGLPVIVRQSRYRLDEGRYRVGSTELIVSRGLGAVGIPFRSACSPEAMLLTLRGEARLRS